MRRDPAYRPITVDEFLAIDFGTDKKFELVDGVIQMMTGGTSKHAHVAGNIYHALRQKLRGSGCLPFNSDMGLRIDETTVRYPDVSVHCGNPVAIDKPAAATLDHPVAIFEVLSQSTSSLDQGQKLDEYRRVESINTIIFVDPDNEVTRTFQRIGATAWRDDMFAQPHYVELPLLKITLSRTEIFARD